MKRTESLVVDTCLLGSDIPIHDIEDLYAGLDVLSETHLFLDDEFYIVYIVRDRSTPEWVR